MGIGVGIVLMAIGAILTFAVHAVVNGIDISTVGVILMIAGAIGVLLDLMLFAPRRRETYATTAAPVQDVQVTRTTRAL